MGCSAFLGASATGAGGGAAGVGAGADFWVPQAASSASAAAAKMRLRCEPDMRQPYRMRESKARPAGGQSAETDNPAIAANRGELATGLYLLATPIGNARDISLRGLEVLRGADVIACEDTRVTAKLLAIHAISKPLIAYNDHNGQQLRPRILAKLREGQRVVLVSDAGTPLVSDPGFKLARAVIEEGLPVMAIPGPSAALAGLMLSGLPSDRFMFAGFLPSRVGERAAALAELKTVQATLIFFEAPQRLAGEPCRHDGSLRRTPGGGGARTDQAA